MPRTLEIIVENHRVAAERRAAGRPVWDRKIDINSTCGNCSTVHDLADTANNSNPSQKLSS